MSCIFCDIISKKAPANVIYEHEKFVIINDIKPDAKVHMLAIPKRHFDNFFDATPEDLDVICDVLKYIKNNAHNYGLQEGYRIIINNGVFASQTVFHCHVQILGGQQLKHPISHLEYNSNAI